MKRLVVVGYAINGRGVGHLMRQLAILRQVRRLAGVLGVRAECWVLTSSEADTLARREGVCALKMPSKAMMRDAGIEPHRLLSVARTWVINALSGLQPDVLIVDTFPAGSFGELTAALELARHRVLVARRVRDNVAADAGYRALLPLYHETVVPDDGSGGPILIRDRSELMDREEARRALGVPPGARAVYASLGGGGDPAAAQLLPGLVRALRDAGWFVVVGAGPLYTGDEVRGQGITWLSRYTPVELLPGVDAAVSAGGYNSFHELMLAGVPTVFLPQPRISDDQRRRVEQAVAAGAGRLASSTAEVVQLLEQPGSAAAARGLVRDSSARDAAKRILAGVLDAADLDAADRLLTPALLQVLGTGRGGDLQGGLALLRLLGASPSDARSRRDARNTLDDLPEQGDGGPERVEAFVAMIAKHSIPVDTAIALLRALARKFPAATPAELVDSIRILLSAWARFDDWMGAVSLLRAVPSQRTLSIQGFAQRMAEWLALEDDLFDALRRFARLEGRGSRPVGEVLALLVEQPASETA